MRAFSTLLIATAFALSANAADVNKHSISAPVQLCIDDINSAASQLTVVKNDVSRYVPSPNLLVFYAISQKVLIAETKIKQAGTDCCAIASTVSDEEAQAVLTAISSFVIPLNGTLSAFEIKKPIFDVVFGPNPIGSKIIKTKINNLNNQTTELDTCLIAKTPSAYLDKANGYVAQIVAAFTSATKVYSTV